MIKEYLNEQKEEQREYYAHRQEVLNYLFNSKEVEKIQNKWIVSKSQFSQVRRYALWLEWEEANVSFDEWLLRWLEMFQSKIRMEWKPYINGIEHWGEWVNDLEKEAFTNWMKHMLEYILK